MNQLSQIAQDLRAEALDVLHGGLLSVLEAGLGRVEIAGSVALDLMTWPDIDLYCQLEPAEALRVLGVIPKLGLQLERQGCALAKVIFNNEHVLPDPKFPTSPGLYAGISFIHLTSGRQWKLDFWGWSEADYAQRHASHRTLERRLKQANRDLILRLKRLEGYGSRFYSVDVYAFALDGAGESVEDFERFLMQPKVRV